jgi:hypothetical protein
MTPWNSTEFLSLKAGLEPKPTTYNWSLKASSLLLLEDMTSSRFNKL